MKTAAQRAGKTKPGYSPRERESGNATARFWRVMALVLTLAAVAFISVMPQVTNDFWLQAKVGELIARDGAIPKTVLFPFTPVQDATFNAHEWLPSLFFYALIEFFGEAALPLLLGALCLVLFGLMSLLAYRKSGGNLAWALLLGLIAVGAENQRNFLRPELLSLILLAAYWLLLERIRRTPNRLDALMALAVVVFWANTHGSFILAPIVTAIYAVGTFIDGRWRKDLVGAATGTVPRYFAMLAVLALVCTMITPFGWEMLKFAFGFTQTALSKQSIMEWLPTLDPRFQASRGWWIGMGILVIASILVVRRWRELGATELLMFAFFAVLAFQAVRFLVYVGMAAAFALAPVPPRLWSERTSATRGYVASAGLAAAVLALAVGFGNAFGAYPHFSPVTQSMTQAMVLNLRDPVLQGNVLTSFDLGAELVYRAYPRLRPSIDSRVDSYGDDYFAFHRQLMLDDALLTRFIQEQDVRYLLLNYEDLRKLMKLSSWTEGRWEVRFRDQRAALLQRREPR